MVFSQDVVTRNNRPVTAASSNENLAAFIGQFETSNVGNLHIYAKPKNQAIADYYYQGTVLDDGFGNYLTADLWKDLRSGASVNAVFAIRYNDQNNLFIINQNRNNVTNKISLYNMEGNQLKMIRNLAYLKETWTGSRKQMDTWIQDVDGDTLLDLIQKERKIAKNGKSRRVKTKVFLQQRDGSFQLSDNTNVNTNDYIFEDLIK